MVMNGPDTSLDETLNNNSDTDREEVEELTQAKIQRKVFYMHKTISHFIFCLNLFHSCCYKISFL